MRIVLPRLSPVRIAGIVALVAAAVIGIYLLVRPPATSDEAQIRALVKEIERAFEKEKLKACLAVAADDYSDNIDHDSKAALENELRLLFQYAREIHVSLDRVTVDIHGDEADVGMTVTARAETPGGDVSLTEIVGHTRYVLALRKERGRWKVYRAEGVD